MSAHRVAGLLTVLQAEEQVYRELRTLLQREREAMIGFDAEALGEIARGKEVVADEGRLLEDSRVELAARLAADIGLVSEPLTLSRLCTRLGAEAEELRAAHARLVAILGAVRELVDANRALGGDRLLEIQTTLRLLGRLLPGSAAACGSPADTTAAGRLIQRSA